MGIFNTNDLLTPLKKKEPIKYKSFLDIIKTPNIEKNNPKSDIITKLSEKIITREDTKSFSKFFEKEDIINKNYSKNIIKDIFPNNDLFLTKDLLTKNTNNIIQKITTKTFLKNIGGGISGGYYHIDVPSLIATLPDELVDATAVENLSIRAKRQLMRVVVKANTELFSNPQVKYPLLPTNKDEYCALLKRLSKSIGFEVRPISEEIRNNFIISMHALESKLPHVDVSKMKIDLLMPRHVFTERVGLSIKGLHEEEQRKVLDLFNFDIKDGKLIGYPAITDNEEKLASITSPHTKKVVEDMRSLVSKFTEENQVILPDEFKSIERELNDLIKAFPEFLTSIGKEQHGAHAYTVDIHTLKVLQSVVSNKDFATLSQRDKKLLTTSVLLHDLAKAEGIVDKLHQTESSFDSYFMTQKLGLPENDCERIASFIRNHHWLEEASNSNRPADLEAIAFNFRNPNEFKIARIFAEGDLNGVSDSFFESHKSALTSDKVQTITKNIQKIYGTGICLPQTAIPKASELLVPEVSVGVANSQTKNKVLYLSQHKNLEQIGFAKGTNNDFNTLVHVFRDGDVGIATIENLASESNGGVLSTSLINRNNFETYYANGCGVLLEHDPMNLVQASSSNMGSGFKKDIKSQINAIFEPSEYRKKFSDTVKSELNLSDSEYAKLYEEVMKHQNFDMIEDKKVRAAFQKAANRIIDTHQCGHNEVTVLAPKPKAIFAKGISVNDIPYALRKYAQDNDMPIVVFEK